LIYGQAGNDFLAGGEGNDNLQGGTGNDTFYFDVSDHINDGDGNIFDGWDHYWLAQHITSALYFGAAVYYG